MIKTIKTKQFKIITFALAVLLILSCVMWNTAKVHALEITDAATNGYNVVGGGTIDENGKLINASIGVFVTGGSADKYNRANMQWTHNGTNWSVNDDKVLFEEGGNQQISAYYPFVSGYTDGTVPYKLTDTQTADTMKNDDLLYAAATNLTAAKTSLTFDHVMTKLSVEVAKLGTEIDESLTVKEVKIVGLATTATFNPKTGELIAGSDFSGKTVASANASESTYDALVFPAQYETLQVYITLSDGSVYTTTVTCADGLAGGTHYTITLQVGQDAIDLADVVANSWGDPIDGGDLATN